MSKLSRVRAEISLDAMLHNMRAMKELINEQTQLIAVIKTDGYGHGAVPIARELEKMDMVYGYAVATVWEGIDLRESGMKKPILILGHTFEEDFASMLQYDICPSVFTLDAALKLSALAGKLQKTAHIHIKLDTGMGRIGFAVNENSADIIAQIAKMSHIMIEGIFTHFAKADEWDKTSANDQIAKYQQMIAWLDERGVLIPVHHCSNSAGIIDLPHANMDVVRAGITLYGLWPSDEVHKERIDLKPVMALKSRVAYVKTMPAGSAISYGGTYVTDSERVIATIPVGYGDGYARSLSNKGEVLIRGQRAPITGRVCMDQFMVDVTDIPGVCEGDEVTLIGCDGAQQITMEDIAEKSGRFNYEFACDLGKRIPRVFYLNGRKTAVWDQFDGLVEEK